MSVATPSPLISELGTERRIVICAALALTLLALIFRNDRALLLGPGAPADRDASAFTAIVAPPVVSGVSVSRFSGPLADSRRVGARAPAIRTGGASGVAPVFVAPGASAGAGEGTPASVLPVESASADGPARSYTPQMASFIGLPGGVIFGSGGTTPPITPTNPTDPTTPTNPTNPVDPTNPTNPTNPVDPTNPTTPTDPIDPTTPPVTTPDPGPGAVPEPVSWALMILGIFMVGGSLRRRRAAEPAHAELVAAA